MANIYSDYDTRNPQTRGYAEPMWNENYVDEVNIEVENIRSISSQAAQFYLDSIAQARKDVQIPLVGQPGYVLDLNTQQVVPAGNFPPSTINFNQIGIFEGGPTVKNIYGINSLNVASFQNTPGPVLVYFQENYIGSMQGADQVGDLYYSASLFNIQVVVGSPFRDIMISGGSPMIIGGGNGDDVLIGGVTADGLQGDAGNDVVVGGAGSDVLMGGSGIDILSYYDSPEPVYVDMSDGWVLDAFGFIDIIVDFEIVLGSKTGDVIVGDSANNVLVGNQGDDFLVGGGGNDTLFGLAGEDGVFGQAGIDTAIITDLRHAVYVTAVSNDNFQGYRVDSADGTDAVDGSTEIITFLDGKLYFSADTSAAEVNRLYLATLDREPDALGLTYWTDAIEAGTSLLDLANTFLASPEWQAKYGALDNSGFVVALYNNVLGRDPDLGGYNYWKALIDDGSLSRPQLVLNFSESPEFKQNTSGDIAGGLWTVDDDAAFVLRAYKVGLDRNPDAGGLAYWIEALHDGTASRQDIANAFAAAPEFVQTYGTLANQQFVEQMYLNALDRPGDVNGVAYWTAYLNGGAPRGVMVTLFAESQELIANTAPLVDDGLYFV